MKKWWSGPAQLCFLFQEEDSLFHGHFLDLASRRCFGVSARETKAPASDAQCCCCQGDDAPTWYRTTIIDFKTGKEFTEVLSKRGGDYAAIHGPHIKFTTESILTEQEAISFVKRNGRFGLSLEGIDETAVLICVGQFEMHSISAFDDSADGSEADGEFPLEDTPNGGHHHHQHSSHDGCCGVVEEPSDAEENKERSDSAGTNENARAVTDISDSDATASSTTTWLRRERRRTGAGDD